MYQWVNPTTGNSQMSGKAPSWYRSESGGPRVLVFERNVLVDDTAVYVSEEQRIAFRNQALKVETSDEKNSLTSPGAIAAFEEKIEALIESPALEEYLKNPPLAPMTDQELAEGLKNEPVKPTQNSVVKESPDDRIERLKLLISAWDKNRTEAAKTLLESSTTEEKSLVDE
ncbi:MAG: hypothetical protein AB8D52_05825 [Gammaproteobacteria bacterium]